MEKSVSAFEVRRQLGRVLRDVAGKGDRVVVERHGEPIAVVVPIEVYRQWKRSRADFFARIQAAAERSGLEAEAAESLAEEAVQAIRSDATR